jgi:hypothetical protein
MKDYFTELIKRILFLIPLFLFTKQKYPLSCDKLQSNEVVNIDIELNKICKEHEILCPMVDAIKYSLKIIKSYSKTYEIYPDISELKYQNAKSFFLLCENITLNIEKFEENKDEKYSITFNNCESKFMGQLFIIDEGITFLSSLFFYKIIFVKRKLAINGELNLLLEYDQDINKTYYYDSSIFSDYYLHQMDTIMEYIFSNYTSNFKYNVELNENRLASQTKYLNDIINKFTKKYSLFDPEIDDDHHNITYIGYNIFTWDNLININNYIYLSNLSVTFEYALDYNITYNEGSFVLDYMNFSKIQKDEIYLGNIIYKEPNFDNIMPLEESNNIWKIIKYEFLNKFINYKAK